MRALFLVIFIGWAALAVGYTEMNSKVGNLAKPAPQIWSSKAALKQLNLTKLGDASGSKDTDVRRSQNPPFEFISVYRTEPITPKIALQRLMEGNERYVKDELEHPNRTQERREASQSSQSPFATIVGCSDSRVSPEIIFDEGVGDLFVVRVAGNVIGPLESDSIEYSVLYLGSSLILVLGHENCGAVKAVIDGQTKDIEAIAQIIEPAIKEGKNLPESIKANALRMKQLLIQTPVIQNLIKKKKVRVEAAYYNLESGAVELL